MITLWLNSNDIPALTAFSGNIDADSLKPHIYTAQTTDLKRILGLELYNKINADYIAGELDGVYKTIYDDYVVDMLTYFSCTNYMAFGGYKTSNNGIYKEGNVDLKEVSVLIGRYKQLGTNVELNFYDYMKTVSINEWRNSTDIEENKVIPWY